MYKVQIKRENLKCFLDFIVIVNKKCLCVFAGIKLTLSALLDGKNINAGGHKLGLGLEFQA